MTLKDLQMDEWDKTYDVIFQNGIIKILLLRLINNATKIKKEGRKNLLAVDKNNNILWFAEPPHIGRSLGEFNNFKIINQHLSGWYGGSVLVEIDLATGKLLKEEFIK